MKTLVISPHKSGGVGKSTNNVILLDAFIRLGAEFRAFDADSNNRKLTEYYPSAIPIDISNEEQVVDLIVSTGEATAPPLTVVDFPGGSIGMVETVFREIDLESLAAQGIRIVQLVHCTNDPISLAGALAWARAFGELAEYVVFANCVYGVFSLDATEDGKRLKAVANGHVATIPLIRASLRQEWVNDPTLPSLLPTKNPSQNWVVKRQLQVLADDLFAAVEPVARFIAMTPKPAKKEKK